MGLDPDLLGREVFDACGERIGQVSALYADTTTGEASFAGVEMIRRGRRRTVFVPLDDARIAPASVTVRCEKELIRRAPYVRPGENLPGSIEPGLYAHYEVGYIASGSAGRRLVRFC